MNRLLFTTTFAALGLTLIAAAQTQAAGPGSGHPSAGPSRHSTMNGRHGEFNHSFRANGRFDYGRHGFRSLSWSKYGWSSRYHTYCYWAPSYGWCFYEPTYSCYLPVSYYPEVYPQASFATAPGPVLTTAPSVVQQTSVVLGGPAVAPVDVPGPIVAPPVTPAPGVVQQTKVGPGVP